MDDKTWLGFWVVIAGLLVLLTAYGMAIWKYSSAADASTLLAAATGTIGAVVGAFFGIQAGASGKD